MSTPQNQLKAIKVSSSDTVRANPTLTFFGGVSLAKLTIEGNRIGTSDVRLRWDPSGTYAGDAFYDMDIETAEKTATGSQGSGEGGEGVLIFANLPAANFRGNIGTPDDRLQTLEIQQSNLLPVISGTGQRVVRILGDIYTSNTRRVRTGTGLSSLRLKGHVLELGNGTDGSGNAIKVFGDRNDSRTYTVNAQIADADAVNDDQAILRIRDFDYRFETDRGKSGNIGGSDRKLKELAVYNARATFTGSNIYATTVNVNAGATLDSAAAIKRHHRQCKCQGDPGQRRRDQRHQRQCKWRGYAAAWRRYNDFEQFDYGRAQPERQQRDPVPGRPQADGEPSGHIQRGPGRRAVRSMFCR